MTTSFSCELVLTGASSSPTTFSVAFSFLFRAETSSSTRGSSTFTSKLIFSASFLFAALACASSVESFPVVAELSASASLAGISLSPTFSLGSFSEAPSQPLAAMVPIFSNSCNCAVVSFTDAVLEFSSLSTAVAVVSLISRTFDSVRASSSTVFFSIVSSSCKGGFIGLSSSPTTFLVASTSLCRVFTAGASLETGSSAIGSPTFSLTLMFSAAVSSTDD